MNGKAELTLEQLRVIELVLRRAGGWTGDESDWTVSRCCGVKWRTSPRHAPDCWLNAAIAEAKRVDKRHGWTRMSERAPESRQAWCATMDAGAPDPSTDEWVFFPYRGAVGEWGWDSGATVLHWREIGPLPEEEPCRD